MAPRAIVVTGLGVVSSLGRDAPSFWAALTEGRSAAAPLSSFDASAYRTQAAAEIRQGRRSSAAYAADAAGQALRDAGLSLERVDRARIGLTLGTTTGETLEVEAFLGSRLELSSARELSRAGLACLPGGLPAGIARSLGLRGPNLMLMNACAAGNYAIAAAAEKIRGGQADWMLAGGVDVLSPSLFAGFNRLLALSPDVCSPFSKDRKGLIPGEGAAVLLLEEREIARRRGATVYAELIGYGLSSDASHVTMPDAAGVVRALRACLEDAGLRPEEVDYISAHGTGTPANDKVETAAIKAVFGPAAAGVPVSSIKSMLGHCMGAASALEAAACCLALRHGRVPPTINHIPGDPDCDLDYVAGGARALPLRTVLSNAFAFGGSNSVIALSAPGARAVAAAPASPSGASLVVTGIGTAAADALGSIERLLPDKDLRFIDEPIACALAAVKRAMEDAKLDLAGDGLERGIVLDSAGELGSHARFYRDLLSQGPVGVEPRQFPNILGNAAASRAAIAFGLKLLNVSLAGSFPAGEAALAYAVDALQRRGRGLLFAGGLWDGATVFVLETEDEARARGAAPYARVVSYEERFDPSRSIQLADCDCLAQALRGIRQNGKALSYRGRGVWGGEIRFELEPV